MLKYKNWSYIYVINVLSFLKYGNGFGKGFNIDDDTNCNLFIFWLKSFVNVQISMVLIYWCELGSFYIE